MSVLSLSKPKIKKPSDALLRVTMTGICGSDPHMYDGRTLLDKEHPNRAKEFYGLIIILTLLGMLINFAGINPVRALFWTAVINGFLAPPLLILILKISNDRKIMGERVNGRILNIAGWTTFAAMAAAAVALI
jgi:Mn2+/Fe2+ NRAMP family transporter